MVEPQHLAVPEVLALAAGGVLPACYQDTHPKGRGRPEPNRSPYSGCPRKRRGLDRYPAIVIEGRAVVYGVRDLAQDRPLQPESGGQRLQRAGRESVARDPRHPGSVLPVPIDSAGNRTEGSFDQDHRNLVYREVDAIGHPMAVLNDLLPDMGEFFLADIDLLQYPPP